MPKQQQSLASLLVQGASNSAPGMAVKSALAGMGALTGCSPNAVSGSEYESPFEPGTELCYMHTDGYNYPVRILDNYGDRRQTVLVDFQGEQFTVPTDRLYDMSYCTPSSMRSMPFTQPPRESTNGDNPN